MFQQNSTELSGLVDRLARQCEPFFKFDFLPYDPLRRLEEIETLINQAETPWDRVLEIAKSISRRPLNCRRLLGKWGSNDPRSKSASWGYEKSIALFQHKITFATKRALDNEFYEEDFLRDIDELKMHFLRVKGEIVCHGVLAYCEKHPRHNEKVKAILVGYHNSLQEWEQIEAALAEDEGCPHCGSTPEEEEPQEVPVAAHELEEGDTSSIGETLPTTGPKQTKEIELPKGAGKTPKLPNYESKSDFELFHYGDDFSKYRRKLETAAERYKLQTTFVDASAFMRWLAKEKRVPNAESTEIWLKSQGFLPKLVEAALAGTLEMARP